MRESNMKNKIKLMKSTFFNEAETKERLCDFIKSSEILSMNSICKEFEEQFSGYQGRKYTVMFNSGSSANLALIQALINLGIIEKGANVGFSALTWATNVMPLIQLGLNPIPIDVDLRNLNISSKKLKDFLAGNKIAALFLTNLLGFCADIDEVKNICDENDILFLEDNCESLGTRINGQRLGNFGIASTFSTFVGHHMSTIEGGMVCTDDEEMYEELLMVRSHGWARNVSATKQKELMEKENIDEFHSPYSFFTLGYNLRPTEINGFLGIEQLKVIDKINDKRLSHFIEYQKAADINKDICRLELEHIEYVSNFAYPLIFRNKKKFEQYKKRFIENNIEIRPIVGGSIPEQPFFKSSINKIYSCPSAKEAHEQGFYIPNNPDLTTEELERICGLLRVVVGD